METRPLLAASEGGTVAATLEIHHGVVALQSNRGPWLRSNNQKAKSQT
jgi:hypothetical protein